MTKKTKENFKKKRETKIDDIKLHYMTLVYYLSYYIQRLLAKKYYE